MLNYKLYSLPNTKKAAVRLLMMLLCSIILVINLSGCGAFYQNYIDRTMDPYEEEVKARATRGEINAILLPGAQHNRARRIHFSVA